jgi:hypothetical protein
MNQGLEGQTKAERQGNITNLYYMGYETHIEGKHEWIRAKQSDPNPDSH